MRQHHLLPPLCKILSCQSGIHSPASRRSSPPCLAVNVRAELRAELPPELHSAHTTELGLVLACASAPQSSHLLEIALSPPWSDRGTSPTCQGWWGHPTALGYTLAPGPLVLAYFVGSISSGTRAAHFLRELVLAARHTYRVTRAGSRTHHTSPGDTALDNLE